MSAVVEIQKRLSDAFALDAAFDIPAGFTVLFGASGSGKTTILRAIAGLTRPDAGRIIVGGTSLFDSNASVDVPVQQRRAGYVFQQLALFPHMTVRDNIAYGLQTATAAETPSRVDAIAESFRIAHLLDRKPGQISGGERQRTALARALVTDPAILLLDEPLSALDHAIQARILDDLRRWNERRKIPALYVTHSHREAYQIGERVIALEHGRIVATGSSHEVLDQPSHRMLATLAGFENIFGATVIERAVNNGTMRTRLDGSQTDLEVPLTEHQRGARITVAVRAGDIMLAAGEPHGISARNTLRGHLLDITLHGPTVIARVDVGATFVVHVTPSALHALQLQAGREVWLVIKTYSCRVLAG